MKKLILIAITVLTISAGPAFAHCGSCGIGDAKGSKMADKADMMQEKMENMTKKLGLSDEQAQKLDAIMKTKMDKKKALHEETESKMESIRNEYKTSLKGILTPEQLEKYETMKEEKGSGHDHGHKGSHHEDKGSHHEDKGSKTKGSKK